MDTAKNRASLTCPKCYVKHLSAALAHTENARAAMNAIVASGISAHNGVNFLGLLNYVSTTDDEIKFLLPEFMNAIMRAKVCVARAMILIDEAEHYDGHEFMALGHLIDAELELNADISTMYYRNSSEALSDKLREIRDIIRYYRLGLQERSAFHDTGLESFLYSLSYIIEHINNNMGPAFKYLDDNMAAWHDSFAYAQAHLMEARREMPDPNHKVHSYFINELFSRRLFPYTSMDMTYDSEAINKIPDFIISDLVNLTDAIVKEIESFTKNSDPNVFSSETTHEDAEGGDQ